MNHTDKCIDLLSGRKNESKPLAQIAEMESKPLTWNERINQMTAEEKADVAVIISKRCSTALEKESCPDLTCWQCFIEFFNSPYTEGATK